MRTIDILFVLSANGKAKAEETNSEVQWELAGSIDNTGKEIRLVHQKLRQALIREHMLLILLLKLCQISQSAFGSF